MKTPIYIYQGEPRVIVEPELNAWRDSQETEQSALIKAHGEGKGFEGDHIWLLLPRPYVTNHSSPYEIIKEAKNKIKDGGPHYVDLPEHTEVRQCRRIGDNMWLPIPEHFYGVASDELEYRTILRFTEGEAKKELTTEEKDKIIREFTETAGKYFVILFKQLGMKEQIEVMLRNDPTDEEWILSLKTVPKFLKDKQSLAPLEDKQVEEQEEIFDDLLSEIALPIVKFSRLEIGDEEYEDAMDKVLLKFTITRK